jgi:hypothetical protein
VTGLYARPDAPARIPLADEPVLESWNAADHPDQLRLHAYLTRVAEQVGLNQWPAQEPRSIELVVGLPTSLPLDRGGRDLDNYLYPLVRHFGAGRIAAAFGRKTHQQGSTNAVGTALPAAEPEGFPQLVVRTSVSAQSVAWKQAIHQACREVVTGPLPSGLSPCGSSSRCRAAGTGRHCGNPRSTRSGPCSASPTPRSDSDPTTTESSTSDYTGTSMTPWPTM